MREKERERETGGRRRWKTEYGRDLLDFVKWRLGKRWRSFEANPFFIFVVDFYFLINGTIIFNLGCRGNVRKGLAARFALAESSSVLYRRSVLRGVSKWRSSDVHKMEDVKRGGVGSRGHDDDRPLLCRR